jgi:hypothetical protein
MVMRLMKAVTSRWAAPAGAAAAPEPEVVSSANDGSNLKTASVTGLDTFTGAASSAQPAVAAATITETLAGGVSSAPAAAATGGEVSPSVAGSPSCPTAESAGKAGRKKRKSKGVQGAPGPSEDASIHLSCTVDVAEACKGECEALTQSFVEATRQVQQAKKKKQKKQQQQAV